MKSTQQLTAIIEREGGGYIQRIPGLCSTVAAVGKPVFKVFWVNPRQAQ